MVWLGPLSRLEDDPIAALTDDDKCWLTAHGWQEPAHSPLAGAMLRSGLSISMANIETMRMVQPR